MRFAAVLAVAFVCSGVFASPPGQPLDCSDWVFLEPGFACTRLFGGVGSQSPGELSPVQIDNTGRLFRFGPSTAIGVCGPGQDGFVARRHPIQWRNGDVWQMFAYVDDRCVTPSSATQVDALQPAGPNDPGMPFKRALEFDPANGRMLVSLVSSCEGGVDCTAYPVGTGDYWVASISGFASTFDVLQTFTPQPASLSFRVPYMPEGMPAADHFDTYWGNLAKPVDFTQAHPLACDYPATSPHVGDYLTVADTVPTPAPGQGVYYLTSANYQGATRYGRKTTAGHLSGRDPAVLPACVP
jgi:hypothetical protein